MGKEIQKVRRGSTALVANIAVRVTQIVKEQLSYYAEEYQYDINQPIRDFIDQDLLPALKDASLKEDSAKRVLNQDDEPVTLP